MLAIVDGIVAIYSLTIVSAIVVVVLQIALAGMVATKVFLV